MSPEAFSQLRGDLFGLAYRMLGSASDAEDVVQDAYERWIGRADRVHNPDAWLRRVVVRLCLDHLRSARVRRETYVGPWLPEPIETNLGSAHRPVDRESLSFGVLKLLERLTPLERAAFVLTEVFDYPAAQVATVLGKREPAVRQLLRRARKHVGTTSVRFAPDPKRHRMLIEAFIDAIHTQDVTRVEALLAADSTTVTDGGGRVTAARNVLHGAHDIARFLVGISRFGIPGMQVREINGWPGIVATTSEGLSSVTQISTDGDRIRAIWVVNNPDKLGHIRV